MAKRRKSAADELDAIAPDKTGQVPWYERPAYASVVPELDEIRKRWHANRCGGKSLSFVWRWCRDRFGPQLPSDTEFVGAQGFQNWLAKK